MKLKKYGGDFIFIIFIKKNERKESSDFDKGINIIKFLVCQFYSDFHNICWSKVVCK